MSPALLVCSWFVALVGVDPQLLRGLGQVSQFRADRVVHTVSVRCRSSSLSFDWRGHARAMLRPPDVHTVTSKTRAACVMKFDGNFNANVSKTICCDRLSPNVNSRAFNPGRDLNSVLADNLKSNPGIKWQYFSSEEGIFTVFPAHKFQCKGTYEHRSR
ncbi:hypothetical protein WMY93_025488 [Mugilogobius chulae]|uniref:Uncharacterized protein n=1 Tax=Mugilogobius chulae TaxID=88201 RepID=A0AAW0N3N0_9GOBI